MSETNPVCDLLILDTKYTKIVEGRYKTAIFFSCLTYCYIPRSLKQKFQEGLEPKIPKDKTQHSCRNPSALDLLTVFHWSTHLICKIQTAKSDQLWRELCGKMQLWSIQEIQIVQVKNSEA